MNSVTFVFPNEDMKSRFIGWMSDGGGEQEFMNLEDNVIFRYDGDTVTVSEDNDE